jgi:hypothetical protein
MGIVNELVLTERQHFGEKVRQNILTEGVQVFESMKNDDLFSPMEVSSLKEDDNLRKLFESPKEKDQRIAALTCLMIKNQNQLLEGYRKSYGEATVVSALGALTPKILDIVRIFYPLNLATI